MSLKKIKDIISETAMLDKYLSTKGVNPKYATMQVKVAHSKTNAFKKWQKDHYDSIKKKELQKQGSLQLNGESVEQIDELKKSTLLSYIGKSTASAKEHSKKSTSAWVKGDKPNADKHFNKMAKRALGIGQAADKLAKEEVEQIDEISKDTVSSYKEKVTSKIDALDKKSNRFAGASDDKGRSIMYAIQRNRAKAQHSKGMAAADKRLSKEEVENLDEISNHLATSYMFSAIHDRKSIDKKTSKALDKQRENWSSTRHKNITKLMDKSDKRSTGIGRALNRLSSDKLSSEAVEADYGGQHQANVLALKAKVEKKPVDMKSLAARMQASYKKDEKKEPIKEGNGYNDNRTGFRKKAREDDEYHNETEPKARSMMDRPHTVHIGNKPWKKFENGHQAHAAAKTLQGKGKDAVAIAHMREETEQLDESRKKEMSKSARMIKALYKKHRMVKEDMYDRDKDEKNEGGYGKAPKHSKADPDKIGDEKPEAAAVLTGGTTLTGEKRDDIEIDPMMRVRPGQPDPSKDKAGSKDKADKKNDK